LVSVAGLVLAACAGILLGSILASASLLVPSVFVPSARTPVAHATARPADRQATRATVAPVEPGRPQPQQAEVEQAQPVEQSSQRVTVLLMGIDSRPGEQVGRTDSIMLLTIDPEKRSAGLMSMARDLLVPIADTNEQAKINTAYVHGENTRYPGGGPAALEKTITNLIGYPIDYYVRVNFEGFRKIIDLIGGIDIDVPKTIDDPTYPDDSYGYDPLYIPAGRVHMDGKLALKYARTRHVDSDYGRARRQQQVVVAVKNKLVQPGNLASLLPRLPSLAVTLARSVQTDMPLEQAVALARELNQPEFNRPASVVIDDAMGRNANDPVLGFVLVPDLNKVRAAAKVVFEGQGTVPARTTENIPQSPIKTEAARVAILNGTHGQGLANKTATGLVSDGFNVVAAGDADSPDYTASWLICYGDGAPVTRETLARKFGIAPSRIRTEAPTGDVDVVVVLGADMAQLSKLPSVQ
jgi:polyisoprenyl-teichoic acid--peptidoglycan teichoic acid transferase